MNDPRGSIWRKWDLHCHTPSSYDYHDKSATNQQIIDTLKSNEIAVAAITDHHTIDVERIIELKRLANNEVAIFPGIELRSELGGSESVHFIGIFSGDSDIADIWTKLQGPLGITPRDIAEKGDDIVYCDFRDAAKLIRELGGIVSIHAGSKSHTTENITNALSFKQAIKRDNLDYIDIYEIGSIDDIKGYCENVFPNIKPIKGPPPPLIICSDNHDIKYYRFKSYCWIKADPTFKGLLQTLYEPWERVFIGDEPAVRWRVRNNKTKYIKSVKINRDADSTYEEEYWFRDIQLEINPELVAIIGNKGNGKSALSDIIGLVGNTKNFNYFSFLNEKKFSEKKQNKARHFRGQIIWATEEDDDSRLLSDNPEPYESENIKYLPQKYLEILCNEEKAEFDKELKKVIFSHFPEDEKLGQNSLDDLIKYQSEVIAENISIFKEDLALVNDEIVQLEALLDDEYQKALNEDLKRKKHELDVLEKAPPIEVKRPEDAEDAKEETKKINDELNSLYATRIQLEDEIKANYKKKADLAKKKAILERVSGEIENFRSQYLSLASRLSKELADLGIKAENIISLEVNEDDLKNLQKTITDEITLINNSLDEEKNDSLINKRNIIDVSINELKSKLDEPHQKYQAYLKELKEWEEKKSAIIGDKEQEGSIKYYERIQKYISEEVPDLLGIKRQERMNISMKIFTKKLELVNLFKSLYKPVELFMTRYNSDEYPIKFDARLEPQGFYDDFFSFISQKAKGSFYGVEDGTKQLRDLVEATDFNTGEAVINLLNQIIDRLERDYRDERKEKRFAKRQLRKDNLVEFYNYLFSLDYVIPKYTLRLGETELNQLSPGEKGALLLIFYLLIDKNDIPLIIDQPEENLDNESVYKLLVNFIKIAKKKRQIIIVTHNPNLAVVCDAEQVIYSKIEKKAKNKVSYLSGSIENPEINKKIIDVLEGTMPAFNNREAKYTISRLS